MVSIFISELNHGNGFPTAVSQPVFYNHQINSIENCSSVYCYEFFTNLYIKLYFQACHTLST